MAIPARIREMLADACEGSIVITAHNEDPCLMIYPKPRWQDVSAKVQALPNTNKVVRRLQRLVIGYATEMDMDANGRVLVPPTLRVHAGLEKKLILMGLGERLELWSEERWLASLDDGCDDLVPEEMLTLSL